MHTTYKGATGGKIGWGGTIEEEVISAPTLKVGISTFATLVGLSSSAKIRLYINLNVTENLIAVILREKCSTLPGSKS